MKQTIDKSAAEIFAECKTGYRLKELKCGETVKIQRLAGIEDCQPGDLVFITDAKKVTETLAKKPAGVVVNIKEAGLIPADAALAVFVSENAGVSYALMRQKFSDRDYTESGFPRIHPSAVIHESVKIPESTMVGPHVVIERGAKIGEKCVLQANVVIEFEAEIGDGTVIQPGSIVGFQCKIGKNCLVLPNSVIGSEGFGYSQDEDFNHYRIPQTGNVEIGDRVTIGALNAIDRGTFGVTKIPRQCHLRQHLPHRTQLRNRRALDFAHGLENGGFFKDRKTRDRQRRHDGERPCFDLRRHHLRAPRRSHNGYYGKGHVRRLAHTADARIREKSVSLP